MKNFRRCLLALACLAALIPGLCLAVGWDGLDFWQLLAGTSWGINTATLTKNYVGTKSLTCTANLRIAHLSGSMPMKLRLYWLDALGFAHQADSSTFTMSNPTEVANVYHSFTVTTTHATVAEAHTIEAMAIGEIDGTWYTFGSSYTLFPPVKEETQYSVFDVAMSCNTVIDKRGSGQDYLYLDAYWSIPIDVWETYYIRVYCYPYVDGVEDTGQALVQIASHGGYAHRGEEVSRWFQDNMGVGTGISSVTAPSAMNIMLAIEHYDGGWIRDDYVWQSITVNDSGDP